MFFHRLGIMSKEKKISEVAYSPSNSAHRNYKIIQLKSNLQVKSGQTKQPIFIHFKPYWYKLPAHHHLPQSYRSTSQYRLFGLL